MLSVGVSMNEEFSRLALRSSGRSVSALADSDCGHESNLPKDIAKEDRVEFRH